MKPKTKLEIARQHSADQARLLRKLLAVLDGECEGCGQLAATILVTIVFPGNDEDAAKMRQVDRVHEAARLILAGTDHVFNRDGSGVSAEEIVKFMEIIARGDPLPEAPPVVGATKRMH